jgi:hypothetical protein
LQELQYLTFSHSNPLPSRFAVVPDQCNNV